MPTYDYRCSACRHEFELFQSMKDAAKRKCPACGKNTLERLIGTGAAILFKGSGFYETDYRSESYRKAAEADKPAAVEPKPDPAKDKAKPEAAKDGGGVSPAPAAKPDKPAPAPAPSEGASGKAKSRPVQTPRKPAKRAPKRG